MYKIEQIKFATAVNEDVFSAWRPLVPTLELILPQSLTPSPPREGRSQPVTDPPKEKVPRVTTDTSDQIILKGKKGVAEEALSCGTKQSHSKQLDAKLLHVWSQAGVSVCLSLLKKPTRAERGTDEVSCPQGLGIRGQFSRMALSRGVRNL